MFVKIDPNTGKMRISISIYGKPYSLTQKLNEDFETFKNRFKEKYKRVFDKVDWGALENGTFKNSEADYIGELKNKFPELDFSNTVFNGWKQDITVRCPIHGEFQVKYIVFQKRVNGCHICGKATHNNFVKGILMDSPLRKTNRFIKGITQKDNAKFFSTKG